MTANVNCTNSLMGVDDPGIQGPSLAVGQMGDARSVSDSSPLQIFVRAKKKINDIFLEIEDYVRGTVTCIQSVQQDGSIVNSDNAVWVEGYSAKVRAIQNVLTRNHMKVAFFGRTSNGKSSVINAMLRENILPCCYGHTTVCFLQVEGSESKESYLVTEGSAEKQNVKSAGQLSNALCKEKLGESQLVHIYWPKDKCLHLRNEVVFVDSPGIDMSRNLDELIDRHCLDADVFVFVANAESTIIQAEKNFFHKVSKRVSKPNIFILNNRWDVVASESDFLDQMQAQHMERAVEFLVTELNACTQKEANQRIFFVSAKEALQARLQEQKGLPAHSGALVDGFPDRYFEFQDFERKFEECISRSAVRTKFEKHSRSGKLIVSEIRQFIDSTYDQAQQLITQKAVAKREIYDKLKFTERQLLLITQEMNDKIRQMIEEVEQKVPEALSEEIRRLSVLVDEFNLPFKPEQHDLNEYKKELHHHVENGLGSNLHAWLTTELAINIENSQLEMTERMSGLLPAEKKEVSLKALPRRKPFKMLYRPNWDNLCADFHEDLDFKFSLEDAITTASIGSIGTAGGLLVVEVKLNEVVQSLIPAVALFYSCNYFYQRHMWNNKAKEREFKQQFVAHVTRKRQMMVDSTSDNCLNQVEQALSRIFEQLCDLVNTAINEMDAEIKTLDKEIKQLEEVTNSAKVLWSKANSIRNELRIFDDEFLKLRN